MFYYLYRRYLGWLPVQFCMICRKPFWGGFPRFRYGISWDHPLHRTFQWTWQPWWQDYCSKKCNDSDWAQP